MLIKINICSLTVVCINIFLITAALAQNIEQELFLLRQT